MSSLSPALCDASAGLGDAPGAPVPAGSDAGVPLLVAAAELALLTIAARTTVPVGVLVLGNGDAEAEQLVVAGLARSGYEAWTIVATGRVPRELNVAGRDPSRLLALVLPPDALPAPSELVEVEVTIAAYDGGEDEVIVAGWYLQVPDLDLRML